MTLRDVVVVSDATGETAYRLARAALTQFESAEYVLRRVPNVRTTAEAEAVVREIGPRGGVILYTLVATEVREALRRAAHAAGVPTVDLIGPLLDAFTELFEASPSVVPGRLHKMDADYVARIEAMEYTFRHDDGMGRRSLGAADIVLVGPSRTGKTPLSMVLANHGFRVANIPFLVDQPLPSELDDLNALVVGLTADPSILTEVRAKRVEHLGSQQQHSRYAHLEEVEREVQAAVAEFTRRGWPIVDVSRKAIEEIATDILQLQVSGGTTRAIT